jgi:HlyD family secretion protein
MRKRLPILILVILAAVGVYLWSSRTSAQSGGLAASGTIETTDVTIAPEAGGRVLEVLAKEGETVQAGQVIIHIDDSLLKAQLAQAQQSVAAAQASRKAAQANYDLLKAGAQVDQVTAAEQAVNNMAANVANAQAQLAQLQAGTKPADMAAAQSALAQAQALKKVMQDNYDLDIKCYSFTRPDGVKDSVCPGLGTREEQLRAQLNSANEGLAAAQARVDQLKRGATKAELDAAKAKVDMAKAQQAQAQAQLDQVKSGARPEQLMAAQAQIEVAQAQAGNAEAAIEVLKVQVDRLTLKAPLAGVVLKRSIEPGEVVLPGASLLKIGDLTNLYIVVYVSESRYGEVKLGQTAQVKVDSFPGETFTGKVAHIADQAEFTPRNVQTAEGRATTVFAVRLDVTNVEGKLKPGMPADVVFTP